MTCFRPRARRIVHLIDDDRPGGVVRMLEHLTRPGMLDGVEHEVRRVSRRALSLPAMEADMIVSHLAISWMALPRLSALRAANPATTLVHVEHSYCEGFTALRVPRRERLASLLRIAYSLFDQVVAVSQGQAAWIERRELAAPGTLRVIPPAVDLAPFLALEPCLNIAPRALGTIGRLDAQKGLDILIDGFRAGAPSGMTLDIFGDGPDREALTRRAEGDPRIRLHGHVDDPAAAMARLDAIAMPSRWEPYGLSALEAMAGGRMLLCSGVDGLRDHVSAGAVAVGVGAQAWAEALGAIDVFEAPGRALRGRLATVGAARRFAADWQGLLNEARATERAEAA